MRNIRNGSKLRAWSLALGAYYAAVEGYARESAEVLRQAVTALLGDKEADKMTVTIAQHWKNEGITIGEARGEAKGQAKAKIESVLIVLDSRFGKIPAGIHKKLRSMQDSDYAEKIIKLAATCESIREFQKAL